MIIAYLKQIKEKNIFNYENKYYWEFQVHYFIKYIEKKFYSNQI